MNQNQLQSINRKNLYIKVMSCNYIKSMQILEKCAISFFYQISIFVKNLKIIWYKNNMIKKKIENKMGMIL